MIPFDDRESSSDGGWYRNLYELPNRMTHSKKKEITVSDADYHAPVVTLESSTTPLCWKRLRFSLCIHVVMDHCILGPQHMNRIPSALHMNCTFGGPDVDNGFVTGALVLVLRIRSSKAVLRWPAKPQQAVPANKTVRAYPSKLTKSGNAIN